MKNTEPNRLANISLCWMLNEIIATETNIIFKEGAFSDTPAFQLIVSPPIVLPPGVPLPSPPQTAGGTISQSHVRDTTEVTFVESPIQEKRKAEPSSTSGVHTRELSTATIGDSTILSVQEQHMTMDATSALHDALAKLSIWWIIELLPQRHAWQDTHGHWKKGW